MIFEIHRSKLSEIAAAASETGLIAALIAVASREIANIEAGIRSKDQASKDAANANTSKERTDSLLEDDFMRIDADSDAESDVEEWVDLSGEEKDRRALVLCIVLKTLTWCVTHSVSVSLCVSH